MLSVLSPLLITFSCIMSLKYSNDHYGISSIRSFSTAKVFFNYVILSFLGVVLTVIPMELLDILRVFI